MDKRHRQMVGMNMSKELKQELLGKLLVRYASRSREGKSRLLDELCEDYKYDRKYAIKLLGGGLPPRCGRTHSGPERRYEVIEPVVQHIWLRAEQPCGKRLVPILRQWLPFYELRHGRLPQRQRQLVGQISAATLDRLLAPARAQHCRGRSGTKPGSLLRSEIPIRTGTWDLSRAGYLEADSVAHCGGSLAGDFIWSLTYTDILSGWTEGGAVWNRGAAGVLAATREVEERLPFGLLGFDSDNGGEFLNRHLWAYMRERKAPVDFTRSRPYHSDDNAHVEQKNWTWARQLLGYGRLENPELVGPISALYREVWAPWQNFFLPCLKLEKKWREGSHWRKRYELPRTAYERLCAPGILPLKERRQLRERYVSLNPFDLKDELEEKLRHILHPKNRSAASPQAALGFRPQGGASAGSKTRPPARLASPANTQKYMLT
jgi:hypothetical protein